MKPNYYLNIDASKIYEYDAIVVGSGISGGWAAKELTEKGLNVIMLERGGDYQHIKDYKSPDIFELPHRGKVAEAKRENKPDIVGWMAQEQVMDSWVGEDEQPLVRTKPFKWVRAYHLGGRSTMWGRQSYRWSDLDFEANLKDGVAVDWPIRYKDIASWYAYVEKFIGVSGSKEGLSVLPDGEFLPPMDMTAAEILVKKGMEKKYSDRKMIIGRAANLTAPIENRGACQFRSRCWEGCHFGAYFSTQSSTLPAAAKTNKLTVGVNTLVTQILYDKESKKATGVEVMDTKTMKTYEFKAKIVFLCASTINSAGILMNSAKDIWPGGLGSSSNELGHNIMDHHYNLGARGTVDGLKDLYVYGKRPNGIYIPRFANVGSDKRNFLRGYGYQGGANRADWGRGGNSEGIGSEFRASLYQLGDWSMSISGFGEVLPDHRNKVSLHADKKDKYGLPLFDFDCQLFDNEMAMREDIKKDAMEMLEAGGCKDIKSYDNGHDLGHGIHEMGTARMGKDPKTSVLNVNNQVWDATNVFVTDGSCMTSAACVNPSLTYMAITARAVSFAVEQLNKQNL